jgi:hypothetical protein
LDKGRGKRAFCFWKAALSYWLAALNTPLDVSPYHVGTQKQESYWLIAKCQLPSAEC